MGLAVAAKRIVLVTGAIMLVVPLFLAPLFLIKTPKAYALTDTFKSAPTWTAPAGISSVTAEVWGGGGGGGSTSSGTGGGGGGAYSSSTVSVTAGNNYTVTVGGGGGIGSNGGDSWFSTSGTVMAKGGTAGADNTGGAGGVSGSGVGTTKFSGGTGGGVGGNGRGGGGGGGSATSSANGGTGNNGQSNTGGTGGTGQGAGGDGGSNNGSGTAGTAPGGGGGGAGNGGSAASGAAGRVAITYTPPVISVSVSDGSVAYSILATNTSANTTSSGLNDTQAATNDGNVAEDFNIKGQSSANWTLSATPGSNQYSHQFCKTGSGSPDPCDASPTWTSLSTSYQQLGANIAASSNQRFDLKINTPTSTAATAQQSVDVTIQAVQH
jgi:hypothetical protein